MTSKIVVNNIEADAGVSTVFFNSDIGATDGTLNVDGNLTVDGVITYEDVTNVDSVGIVTARSGLHVTSGLVGLGTDNPTKKLQVFDSSATSTTARANTVARFLSNASNADCNIQLSNGVDHSAQIGIVGNGAEVYIAQDGIERLRINSSGNIGIGTDNPTETLTLNHANGASIGLEYSGIENGTISVNSAAMYALAGTGKHLILGSDGAEKLRITSDGDMRLGTGTPTSFGPTFQVAGTDPALLLQDTATAVDYFGMNIASGAVNTWFDDASAFVIHTATAISGPGLVERLRITSGGNVGIGTENPGHVLDLYNSSGTDCLRLNVNGNAGGTNKQNAIRFSVDGDVKAHMGIVVDANRLITGSTANDFCLKGLGSNNILIATNSSEKLRITSAGYIGVNNTNPQGIIDVTSSVTSHGLGVVLRKDFNGPVDNTVSKLALTLWGQDHDDAISGSGTDQFGPMIGFGARNDDVAPNTGDIRAAISYSYNGDLVFHAKAGSPGVADGQYERLRIDGLTGMLVQKGFVTTSAERRTSSISAGTYTFGTVSDAFAGILYVTGTHNNGHSTRMYIINKSTNGTGVTLVGDGDNYSPARVDITLSGNNLRGQVYYGNRPVLQMITLRGSYTHTLAES